MFYSLFWTSFVLLRLLQAFKLSLCCVILLIMFAKFSLADAILDINEEAVSVVIQDYEKQCTEALNGDTFDGLQISAETFYQLKIDDYGTDATVLISDFSCGELGPIWCGSGGCDTYLFINGQTFVWRVSWAPHNIQIPTNRGLRTALLFPLSGAYCKTSTDAVTSTMTSGCYAIASWDKQLKTFITTVDGLKDTSLFD